MNIRRLVFSVLAVLWMAMIFAFSAAEGDESEKLSSNAGKLICRLFVPGYNDLSHEEQEHLAEKVDYPIRKTAHAAEYAMLGFLIAGTAVSDFRIVDGKRLIYSFLAGVAYAASDEFHQLFVPGRSGRVTDVLIDSAGVLSALLIFAVIQRLVSKHSRESYPAA